MTFVRVAVEAPPARTVTVEALPPPLAQTVDAAGVLVGQSQLTADPKKSRGRHGKHLHRGSDRLEDCHWEKVGQQEESRRRPS